MTESNTDITDLQKNDLSYQLYKNKDFQSLTDGLPVEMIHELETDQEFFKILVNSAAPKLPAQVSVPIAPVAVNVVEAKPIKAVDGMGI